MYLHTKKMVVFLSVVIKKTSASQRALWAVFIAHKHSSFAIHTYRYINTYIQTFSCVVPCKTQGVRLDLQHHSYKS